MDEFTRRVFLYEIRKQCDFALASYEAIQRGTDPPTIFYYIQSFLVSSANVSKILFPRGIRGNRDFIESCTQRGEALRSLLGVDQDSVLRQSKLRDSFEHFDERIQAWAERPGPKNFFDMNVVLGSSFDQGISIAGANSNDFFRNYVAPPPTVIFWGQEYALEPIMLAIRDLLERLPRDI